PSFFMVGVGRQLFVPLSLAVGFAMMSSYILSSTLVPVMSTWLMRPKPQTTRGLFARLREGYGSYLKLVIRLRWAVVGLYLAAALLFLYIAFPRMGTEIFPLT